MVRSGFVCEDDCEAIGLGVLFEVGLTEVNQGMDLAIRFNTRTMTSALKSSLLKLKRRPV